MDRLELYGEPLSVLEPADPIEAPLPHLLYRALKAGTPFTLVRKPPSCSRAPVKRRSGTICTCSVETLSGRLRGLLLEADPLWKD